MDAVLSVNAWNINGAYSSLFGNKLDQEGFFLSKVKEMDFFAVARHGLEILISPYRTFVTLIDQQIR